MHSPTPKKPASFCFIQTVVFKVKGKKMEKKNLNSKINPVTFLFFSKEKKCLV